MAVKPSTAAILHRLGNWIGWFGNAIGLPMAIFGLFSFWLMGGAIAEKTLIVATGILIFGLGRALRHLCRRVAIVTGTE